MNPSIEKFTNVKFTKKLKHLVGEAIKDGGMTQEKIAKEADISPGALSNYLAGRLPGIPEIEKLAKALGVLPAFLLDWDIQQNDLRLRESAAAQMTYGLPNDEIAKASHELAGFIGSIDDSLVKAAEYVADAKRNFDLIKLRLSAANRAKLILTMAPKSNSESVSVEKASVEDALREQRETEAHYPHSGTKPKRSP